MTLISKYATLKLEKSLINKVIFDLKILGDEKKVTSLLVSLLEVVVFLSLLVLIIGGAIFLDHYFDFFEIKDPYQNKGVRGLKIKKIHSF